MLRLVVDTEALNTWARAHYSRELPINTVLRDRYPLALFVGDVGCGKTETAEVSASLLSRDWDREGRLFKLSTRVRGSGQVGEMGTLLNRAFQVVEQQAGRDRVTFLVIDEGDSLASARDGQQSHHEDKVGVNTLIQKIDGVRRFNGRVIVFLCTNRGAVIDAAIRRRAAVVESFDRPSADERLQLFRMDLAGLRIAESVIKELVTLTDATPDRPGYTFSDIRTRLLPDALSRAFPDRPLTADDLMAAVRAVGPTPSLAAVENGRTAGQER